MLMVGGLMNCCAQATFTYNHRELPNWLFTLAKNMLLNNKHFPSNTACNAYFANVWR